jgi:hypothetical protein
LKWEDLRDNIELLCEKLNQYSSRKIADKCNNQVSARHVRRHANRHGLEYDKELSKWYFSDEKENQEDVKDSDNQVNKEIMDDPVNEPEDNSDSIHIEEYPNYYYFYNAKEDVTVSKKLLKKIYYWYCEDGLTQKEVTDKAPNIDYKDFRLIKKALNLVHGNKPHPDFEFREKSVEELVEDRITRKHQKYDELYEVKENRRLKRIEKKYMEDYYFTKMIIDELKDDIKPIEFNTPEFNIKTKDKDREQHVTITDWHKGKKVTGEYILGDEEGYNSKVFDKRFQKYMNDIIYMIKRDKPNNIVIANLGDGPDNPEADTYDGQAFNQDISGNQQLFDYEEALIELIKIVHDYIPDITYYGLPGNHSSGAINWDIIANHHVSQRLSKNKSIKFKVNELPFKVHKTNNYNCIYTHGNNIRKGNNTREIDVLNIIQRLKLQQENCYVMQGHWHTLEKEGAGHHHWKLPSLVGNDDLNANKMNVFSRAAQMIFEFTKDGLEDFHITNFD